MFENWFDFAEIVACARVIVPLFLVKNVEGQPFPLTAQFFLPLTRDTVPLFLVKNVEGQPFPLTAHFFLLLFTVLVSIILMNLLVGLAVSDIQGLSKSAKLDQLIQQVCPIGGIRFQSDFEPFYIREKPRYARKSWQNVEKSKE